MFQRWRREFDWWAQNRLTWSPPAPAPRPFAADDLAHMLDPIARQAMRTLQRNHDLTAWNGLLDRHGYHLNLYILDTCQRYFNAPAADGPALDIGCKDWDYLPALAAWRGTAWDGVEIDAHRRHVNLVTRRAYGERMAKAFPGSRYLPRPLQAIQQRYSLMTWFLPFVLPEPLRHWHLPERLFQPQTMLEHAWGLLLPGGCLFIINQGEEEAAAQAGLFSCLDLPAETLGEIESPLSPFRQRRFGWRLTKP